MKIGILETGHLSETLRAKYGRYPAFFQRLVGPHLPEASFFTVAVVDGEEAESPAVADGWIITGSRSGAYDGAPWMPPLEAFLRACLGQGVPVVGICFGHQILAQAMGGKVEKSAKGWGVGMMDYQLATRPGWLADMPGAVTLPAIHQDQVITAPAGTRLLLRSAFCPIAGLVYGPPEAPKAFTIQPHPEMTAEFLTDISKERLRHIIPAETMNPALKTFSKPGQQRAWGQSIARFFQTRNKG